ncbi:VOC family protein [Nakamurella endophytica]|uniref:VOC family protein n=1 Tax=Nakamurella endophytica TaxID=1748367 RepID=A0A917WFK9_9ACTN|nr:VOC family protein [Nakamurella endophytica]GGL98282.1 VOC family protein [Nakamurella endophytica]
MSVQTVAHLNFHGQARAALEFYRSVFGGQLIVATYGDMGMPAEQPDAGKVVFGQVLSDNGFRVMAYDVPGHGTAGAALDASAVPSTRRQNGMTLTGQPFFVSVRGDSVQELETLWEGLSDGATIVEPLAPSAWAPAFGMLTDRFGTTWILDVPAPQG